MNFASCICDFFMPRSTGSSGIRAYIYKEAKMNYSKDAMSDQISHCLHLGFEYVVGYYIVSTAGIGA